VRRLQHEPEQHASDDRPDDASDPADDDHGEREEREDRFPEVGVGELGVNSDENPGERTDRSSEHQALELNREDVLSQASGGVLVVADPAQHPTPGATNEQEDEQRRERDEGPPDEHHPQRAVAEGHAPDAVLPGGYGVPVVEGVGEAADPERAAAEAFERTRLGDEPEDLGG